MKEIYLKGEFGTEMISDFKPHKTGFNKVLGGLETEIMNIVWAKEKATARDVYETMRLEKRIAYTTVLTVLNRLAKKGLLKKNIDKTAFIFSPVMSQTDFAKQIVNEVLDGLVTGFSQPVLNYVAQWLNEKE